MKILMVCLGNICRSPLAEGIMKTKIAERGLDWKVDSAGTGAWHVGEPPDPRSIDVAERNGIDIRKQRARQFQASDFNDFDHILVMDASNYQNVRRMAAETEHVDKVNLILNFSNPGLNLTVPDPYYRSGGFDDVFALLDQACQAFIDSFS